jgi:hypothetical protein
MRCAELEIGRNSVRPCSRASKMACKLSMCIQCYPVNSLSRREKGRSIFIEVTGIHDFTGISINVFWAAVM